jgi:hypothetical protein
MSKKTGSNTGRQRATSRRKNFQSPLSPEAQQGSQRDFDKFIDDWVYGIQKQMLRELSASDDIRDIAALDKSLITGATVEPEEILEWFWVEDNTHLTAADKEARIRAAVDEALKDKTLSERKWVAAILRAAGSRRARRGRPRSEDALYALPAFELHLKENMAWSQIALKLKGCPHEHPEGRSCKPCTERMRGAVRRLEEFLKKKGLYPKLPRRHPNASEKAAVDRKWRTHSTRIPKEKIGTASRKSSAR